MMLKGSSELVTAVGQGGTSPEFGAGRQLQEDIPTGRETQLRDY